MKWLRKHGPQIFRRFTQLSVVAFVIYTAFGGAWRNFKLAHNNRRLVGLIEGDGWAFLYGLNEDVLSLFGEPAETSLNFLAFPWAGRVFGLDTADPILVAASALRADVFQWQLLVAVAVPLLLAAVLGKVFCSHLCPMRLVFEFGSAVRRGLDRLDVPVGEFESEYRLGGWVLLGGLVASTLSNVGIWLFILPYVSLSASIFLFVTAGTVTWLLAVVLGWFAVEAVVAPGYFCKNVCPTGFILEQFGRFSLVQLVKKGEEPCPAGCDLCERSCPYALRPMDRTHRPICDNCGKCASVCPSDRLVRRLPVIAALVLAVLVVPDLASAHHNKGLPHYGYYENYPQVPTEEYVVIHDRWEIGATIFNFQGYERAQADTPNDVKIFLYLYDLDADEGYRGPLDVEIEYDGVVVSRFDRVAVDEEAVYSTRETLPESGDYEIVAYVDGEPIRLPFHVDLVEDQVNWGVVAAIGTPVAILFWLALLGRRRRRRRRGRGEGKGKGPSGKASPKASSAALVLLVSLGALGATLPLTATVHAQEDGQEDTLAEGSGPAVAAPTAANCLCGAADRQACAALSLDFGDFEPSPIYDTDDGSVMVMGGIPPWLFLVGVAAIILLSFVATERFLPRVAVGRLSFRKNLLANRRVYRIVRSRWFQAVPQLLMIALLGALVYAGLFGSQLANVTPVAVWTIWWAGLIFTVLFLASAWCFVCPWDGLASIASRLRAVARVEPLSLALPFPGWLKNVYPAIALFALLTWLELGYGVTTDARTTAYLGLGMAAMAISGALLWDGKRFCAHACPVGRICGIYSMVSPVEIRGRKARTCEACTTEDCLHGNERGYPCPTGISLKTIETSSMCTMCTECIKSCDKQNIAFNIRPFGADLTSVKSPRVDEAWLAVVLLTLTLFHGLSMTSVWEDFAPGSVSILKWIGLTFGTPRVVSFTLAMVVATAVPVGLYWLACIAASRWARGGVSAKEIFTRYAYSLLPIALFYHLAHNLMHILAEGGEIIPLLSDPLGTGADYLGTAAVHVGALVSDETLWYLQVGLILIGHVFGVVIAHRLSRGLFSDGGAASRSLVPITLMMVVISVAGLGLMHLDMNMRLGRT